MPLPDHATLPNDRFFRHLVGSMRNGVIAIHRDGTLALMNDEAYRIFSHSRAVTTTWAGRFSDLFRAPSRIWFACCQARSS